MKSNLDLILINELYKSEEKFNIYTKFKILTTMEMKMKKSQYIP